MLRSASGGAALGKKQEGEESKRKTSACRHLCHEAEEHHPICVTKVEEKDYAAYQREYNHT